VSGRYESNYHNYFFFTMKDSDFDVSALQFLIAKHCKVNNALGINKGI
jgi:hypothetical protein